MSYRLNPPPLSPPHTDRISAVLRYQISMTGTTPAIDPQISLPLQPSSLCYRLSSQRISYPVSPFRFFFLSPSPDHDSSPFTLSNSLPLASLPSSSFKGGRTRRKQRLLLYQLSQQGGGRGVEGGGGEGEAGREARNRGEMEEKEGKA